MSHTSLATVTGYYNCSLAIRLLKEIRNIVYSLFVIWSTEKAVKHILCILVCSLFIFTA